MHQLFHQFSDKILLFFTHRLIILYLVKFFKQFHLIYAVGGGLLEVLVSPVVEACPSDNKEKAMSLLHSFYCWGHAGVVLISTVFFYVVGIDNWKILAIIWAVIPIGNAFVFSKVPIAPLLEDVDTGLGLKEFFRIRKRLRGC